MERTVILLHGWTMRGDVFENLVDLPPSQFDYKPPDLPGHGKAADLPPTLSAGAELLGGLVKESL